MHQKGVFLLALLKGNQKEQDIGHFFGVKEPNGGLWRQLYIRGSVYQLDHTTWLRAFEACDSFALGLTCPFCQPAHSFLLVFPTFSLNQDKWLLLNISVSVSVCIRNAMAAKYHEAKRKRMLLRSFLTLRHLSLTFFLSPAPIVPSPSSASLGHIVRPRPRHRHPRLSSR
jgi:hypothetical protein